MEVSLCYIEVATVLRVEIDIYATLNVYIRNTTTMRARNIRGRFLNTSHKLATRGTSLLESLEVEEDSVVTNPVVIAVATIIIMSLGTSPRLVYPLGKILSGVVGE